MLYARRPVSQGSLIQHSDRGVQYLSIRYTERLAEAGVEPSVGNCFGRSHQWPVQGRGDPSSSLAESEGRGAGDAGMGGLVQPPTALEPIGNRPPAEAEAIYHQQLNESPQAA